MQAEIDLLIRGALFGACSLCFVVLLLNRASRAKSFSMGAVAIALGAHMAVEQGMGSVWSQGAQDVAFVLGQCLPLALTWFVLDVFLDREKRRVQGRALLILAAAVTTLGLFTGAYGMICVFAHIALQMGLLYVVLISAQGDLVEDRRSFRVLFVAAIAVFGILKSLLDLFMPDTLRPEWFGTAYALALLGFTIVFAHWALRPDGGLLAQERPSTKPKTASQRLVDRLALDRIGKAMAEEIWRREGLTIGIMAKELGLPEHRLRKAINRDMGFRNFASFVNAYRIDAAKEALAAPDRAQQTVLEIAYDCGFASLAPFNKAFRTMTGKTPSNFRRDSLQGLASISA